MNSCIPGLANLSRDFKNYFKNDYINNVAGRM